MIASQKLRNLVQQSGKTLVQISIESEVPYQTVQKWAKGELTRLDLDYADRIHKAVTGKPFTIGA